MTNLVILDLVSNNYEEIDLYLPELKSQNFLALTPSAIYCLEQHFQDFITFHDIISVEVFRDKVLTLYTDVIKANEHSKNTNIFLIELAKQLCQTQFIDCLLTYLNNQKFDSITYITDRAFTANNITLNNDHSNLFSKYLFNHIIPITRLKQKKISKKALLKRYSILEISKKIISKIFNQRVNLGYDWFYIAPSIKKIVTKATCIKYTFKLPPNTFLFIPMDTIKIFAKIPQTRITNFLTFLDTKTYQQIKELKKHYPFYFFQHGSYLYKNLFIKYNEVEPATINFVFNDYTQQLFKNLGAKKIYSVGSVLFNQPIRERQKEYDFLYITQGHDYTGNNQYVDFPNSLHSFDGYELYQRHKNIIEMFGKKYKDKKIVIRVHPTVVSTGLYVPFWELAKPYSNITIDVNVPVHHLIEKARYIISDYFTSEFINRELHYQRDIILFNCAPTPLPHETIEDMKKMFILVDTVDDLKEKVKNIEIITKDRPRYDDVIEYYSSKKCDTKQIVNEILKKELNGRR